MIFECSVTSRILDPKGIPIQRNRFSSCIALLFPVLLSAGAALAADAIPIADRACLFLDDRFVAEQSGLTRTWHQGRPQAEPAITGQWPHMFGSVLYDPQAKRY